MSVGCWSQAGGATAPFLSGRGPSGGGGMGAQTYFFPPSFFFLFHASCSSVEKESLVDLSLSQ